jgi:hypothetical protein
MIKFGLLMLIKLKIIKTISKLIIVVIWLINIHLEKEQNKKILKIKIK